MPETGPQLPWRHSSTPVHRHDTVAFIDAPDALDMVLTKHVRGKVVLEIV